METITSSIEPLLERAETYGKTTLELFKLKLLEKTAATTATLISRLLLLISVSFFLLTLTVAIALWIGHYCGENYYGFLIVASFYATVGIILYAIHPFIKKHINNSIITQLLN